jgi:hypothetical protein
MMTESVPSTTSVKVPYEEFKGSTTAEKRRFIREYLKLSPTQFAAIANVNVSTYYSWEGTNHRYFLGNDAVTLIAGYAGVPKEWIKPSLSHQGRYLLPYFEIRRRHMIESLWPDGDQPADDKEVEKRTRDAIKLYPDKIKRDIFTGYFLDNADKMKLAAMIGKTSHLVARHAADALSFLHISHQAQRILKGLGNNGVFLEDPITELRPCDKFQGGYGEGTSIKPAH